MPDSPYFLANTFSHLLGSLIVTGISVENPLFSKPGEKPITNLAIVITGVPFLYLTYVTEPSPLKYFFFFITCFILGQSLFGIANRLEMENELSTVLLNTSILFASMSFIGVLDNQNALGWGLYLTFALFSLIILNAFSYFSKSDKKRSLMNLLLCYLTIILFVLFVGFDYINESMNLYYDLFNLLTAFGKST